MCQDRNVGCFMAQGYGRTGLGGMKALGFRHALRTRKKHPFQTLKHSSWKRASEDRLEAEAVTAQYRLTVP